MWMDRDLHPAIVQSLYWANIAYQSEITKHKNSNIASIAKLVPVFVI